MEPLSAAVQLGDASCVCLGSGRFLVCTRFFWCWAESTANPIKINEKSKLAPATPLINPIQSSHPWQRAVLVPALEQAGLQSIIFQTRGDSFPTMMYGER